MAESLETIAARLRTEYPYPQYVNVGGQRVQMTQEQYDLWIADSANNIRAQQLADEAEAQRAEIRRRVAQGTTRLEANYVLMTTGNPSAVEQRRISNETTEVVYWLVKIMQDKGLLNY